MADSDLFFAGSIEQAIGATVQNQKPLVVFVTDELEASSRWETEYLQDGELLSSLKEDTVTIRLLAGSVEAGHLAAFCPVTTYPTVLVIKYGTLAENIVGEVEKDIFISRLKAAIEASAPPVVNQTQAPAPLPQTSIPAPAPSQDLWDSPTESRPPSSSRDTSSGGTSTPTAAPPSIAPIATSSEATARTAALKASMAEQTRARVAALKAKREAEEARTAKEREQARKETIQAQLTVKDKVKERGNQVYIAEQKKRREQANSERQRVLAQIEADKIGRREKEERRKMVERLIAESTGGLTEMSVPVVGSTSSKSGSDSEECALSFRLLDGSVIRARFMSEYTVKSEVRKWVDEYRIDEGGRYTLSHVMPPTPAKAITEETKTLRELGLTPSANLVLVPVTKARKGEGPNFIVAFFLMIWNFIQTFLGLKIANAGAQQQESLARPANVPSSSSSTTVVQVDEPEESEKKRGKRRAVYTLHDGEDDDEEKRSSFYNGNQLDFEPRKPDEDNK